MIKLNLAGLLACSAVQYLPIAYGQWREDWTVLVNRAYSYGDSAGFAPDFPFKDAIASTKIAANLH
jgi:hypothetical protein